VILAVVVVNASVGFIQEGKAEKAMDAIRSMLALEASVVRDGERRRVAGESLVPGDIVLREAGEKVAADLRLVVAHGLQVQEAILTGESVPVDKDVQPVPPHAPLGDRACMAHSGTLVTSGFARGVVVATGADTEIGRISDMLSSVEVLTTPRQRVLALALRSVSPEKTVLELSDVEGGLTLVGLVGLIDPPRPEAIEAVTECHGAGIRVKMITGDHQGTAVAIGRQIGLQNPDEVSTGAELDGLDDAALGVRAREVDVFARTSPEHKLRLVMALQAHGSAVAMTGDGVNDAPALAPGGPGGLLRGPVRGRARRLSAAAARAASRSARR